MGKKSEIEIQINSVLKLLLTSGRISKSEFLTSYTPYYLSTFSLLSHSTHPTLSTLLVSNTTFSPYFFSFQPTFTPSLTLLSSHFHSILFTFTQRSLPTHSPTLSTIFYTLSTDFIAHLITFPFSDATLSSLSLLSQPIFMHHFLSLLTLLSLSPHTSFFSLSPNFSLHSHTTDWP